MTDQTLRTGGVVLQRASGILGWAALGEFVGHFAGLGIPDALISDTMLGHAAAIVMVVLGIVGAWIRPLNNPDVVQDQLARLDLLFLRGTITDHEHARLRSRVLRRLID